MKKFLLLLPIPILILVMLYFEFSYSDIGFYLLIATVSFAGVLFLMLSGFGKGGPKS